MKQNNVTSIHAAGHDYFPQALMDELIAARKPYRIAYDTLYRRERMLRYAHWLVHSERPSFNITGTWIPDQMRTELAMWTSMHKRNLDDAEVIETVTKQLEQQFDWALSDAQALVTNPDLAHHNSPIWNVAADCLVPQKLGDFQIAETSSYQNASDGHSYTYRHTLNDAPLTLYIYDSGLAPVKPGLSDPRFEKHFAECMCDVENHPNSGSSIDGGLRLLLDPQVEVIRTRFDVEVGLASANWDATSADGQRRIEALSVTGFRGMFLKVRLTTPDGFIYTDAGQTSLNEMELDLADFIFEWDRSKQHN